MARSRPRPSKNRSRTRTGHRSWSEPVVLTSRCGRSPTGAAASASTPVTRAIAYAPFMGALRVVLADDNFLVREGVAKLLAEVDDLELVDSVGDPEELIASVAEHRPDAVLTDIRMPPTHTTEGIEAAKRIRTEHPQI